MFDVNSPSKGGTGDNDGSNQRKMEMHTDTEADPKHPGEHGYDTPRSRCHSPDPNAIAQIAMHPKGDRPSR